MTNGPLFVQDRMILGTAAGGEGRFLMEGGLANIGVLEVGGAGTGHVLQTGGSVNTLGIIVGRDSGGQGTYDLNGGTVNELIGPLGSVTVKANPGAAGTFNLNGGTLNAFSVENNDKFLFTKGTYEVGSTTNTANFTVGGPGAAPSLTVNTASK